MKSLIVTIQSQNYGNRLQNYALQETLRYLGHNVETLLVKDGIVTINAKSILRRFIGAIPAQTLVNTRWRSFNKYIEFRKVKHVSNINVDEFDVFIAGSDQIWNPYFRFNSEREFLTFAPVKRRIAYAGSIGVNDLPENVIDAYRQKFAEFAHISVRERAGADIIKKLNGIDVPIVLDPTMLLSKETWSKLAFESKISVNGRYIVKYFLGESNEHNDKAIYDYADKNNIEIIDILETKKYRNIIGPIEFIWLLANSEFNFVDSFHGAVFSIIFEKKYFVFDRPAEKGTGKMNSRIDTLLSTFESEDKLISTLTESDILNYSQDYEMTKEILGVKREESIFYLKNSIKSVLDH